MKIHIFLRFAQRLYSDVKWWNWRGGWVHLFRMDGQYMPRHGWGNLVENKIEMDGICHNEIHAEGKTGQDPTCQSLQ